MQQFQKESSTSLHVAILALACFVVILLFPPLYRLGLWLELPNEGWNAVHTINAFQLSLYPQRGDFFINNYPPLWFYLTGGLLKIFGDPIIPGRVVALLAFFATSFGIYATLRQLNASRVAGLIASLCYMAILSGLLGAYVGLAEPQMLAHALVTNGTAILIAAKGRRLAIVAALVIVTGLFVKHIAIALPLASAFWLFRFRRPIFWPWLIACASISVVATGLLLNLYGSSFIYNFMFPRVFDLNVMATNLGLVSKVAVPLTVYCVVAWQRRRETDPAMVFGRAYIVAALITLVMFGSVRGVSMNSVFDLLIASSIGLGLAWDRFGWGMSEKTTNIWRVVVVAIIAVRVGAGLSSDNLLAFDRDMRARLLEHSAVILDIRDALKSVKGPIACETLASCAWAGHASKVDLWKIHYETTLGPFMDTNNLLLQVSRGDYAAVVLFGNYSSATSDRFLGGLFDVLKKGYLPPSYYGRSASILLPKPKTPGD